MSAVLPTMPTMPNAPGSNASADQKQQYDQQMLKYQEDMARYNRTLQFMQQQQNEEQSTRSNMAKSRHDAMMSIISNMKA
ncbi:MAG TPA: hypothetical protein VGC76_18430 [Pyrinomonadaceae bacterium]|jgi:hypothetical protein